MTTGTGSTSKPAANRSASRTSGIFSFGQGSGPTGDAAAAASSSTSRGRVRINSSGGGNDETERFLTELTSQRQAPIATANTTTRQQGCLPLSMRLLKYTPGFGGACCTNCCLNCAPNSNEDLDDALAEDYDLASLRGKSAASPMVMAPMKVPNLSSLQNSTAVVERLLLDYANACHLYQTSLNVGVVATLRYSLPCLRVVGPFGNADMLAVSEVLLRHVNGPLRYLRRLDFSDARCRIGGNGTKNNNNNSFYGIQSHGALALAKVLQKSEHLHEVRLQRNRIGAYGATALFIAVANNTSIHTLALRRCRIGERSAFVFVELIATSLTCGLREVDLSANYIGFKGCLAIEQALIARANSSQAGLHPMIVNMEGNLVLQEIMSGVTHGLGVLLAFAGSALIYEDVKDKSARHFISGVVYSTSLVVLYVSSTLYHSFVTLQHTKYIFEVLDKCAIYILIAGSYTPFLQIVLWDEPLWSTYLLSFIWTCCFLGILVEFFFPLWKHKAKFSLSMYLGMGWSSLVCLPEVTRSLPEGATNLMILGGVGYTAGVPFFVRNYNMDHAIWHLFVLAGSIFHWCGIYFYVLHNVPEHPHL
jgi:hemolysin III